jgi:hypothetical protein
MPSGGLSARLATLSSRALGADVAFLEIDLATGNGGSNSCTLDDDTKNIAVCVAGCRAEHTFSAPSPRSTKMGDFRAMRTFLARIPVAERRAARSKGYRLADEALRANADVVRRIADALFAPRFADKARIEGDELDVLLAGTEPTNAAAWTTKFIWTECLADHHRKPAALVAGLPWPLAIGLNAAHVRTHAPVLAMHGLRT